MKQWRKSKSVSWAPDVNLCQVKLFMETDCPSEVSGGHHKTLQTSTFPSNGTCDNYHPPGFEGGHYVDRVKYDMVEMPMIRWRCPPKFVLNCNWQVAAAEESKEVETQKLREIRVLEAVYPRVASVPPNPFVSVDVEVEEYDDSRTPLVPEFPIENEEGSDMSSSFSAGPKTLSNSQTAASTVAPGPSISGSMPVSLISASKSSVTDMLSGLNSEVIVAALTEVKKSKELESSVDTDLLIKILGNPAMVEKLIHDHGNMNGAGSVAGTPVSTSEPKTGIPSLPFPKPASVSSQTSTDRNSNRFLEGVPAPRPDSIAISMSNRVNSSVPSSSSKNINMISGHGAANFNTLSTLNQFQPAPSMMPVQSDCFQKVQLPVESTPMQLSTGETGINMIPGHKAANGNNICSIFNQMKPALSLPHVLSNTIQKVQPAVSSTRMLVNAVPDASTVKNLDYIKSLIRDHGTEKQETKGHNMLQTGSDVNQIQNLNLVQKLNPVASKTQSGKPCMFFNSSRGCRNGSNCSYLHDMSLQWQSNRRLEAPTAKRMKFDPKIAGMI